MFDQQGRNDPVGDLQDEREQLRMCSEEMTVGTADENRAFIEALTHSLAV